MRRVRANPLRRSRRLHWSTAMWSRAAVLPLAALAVHELRYKLAFGSGSAHAEAVTGHGYLGSIVPWILLVAVAGIVGAIGRLYARRPQEESDRPTWSALRVWIVLVATLVATFAAQEYLEGLFADGHPTGLASIIAGGGLWCIPAAMLVAGVLVLTLRGERALATALARPTVAYPAAASAPLPRPWTQPRTAPRSLLGTCAGGRAPPATLAPLV